MSHKNGRENIGSDLPSVDTLYTLCGRKAQNILRDHHHTVSFPVQSEGIKVQPKTSLASEHQHPQGIVLQQLFPSYSQTTCWRKYHTMKFIMLSFNTKLTHIKSEPSENSSSPPPESVGLCMWRPLLSPRYLKKV